MYILFDFIAFLGLIFTPIVFLLWVVLRIRKKPSASRWLRLVGVSLLTTILCFVIGVNITPESVVTSTADSDIRADSTPVESIEELPDQTEIEGTTPPEQPQQTEESPSEEATSSESIDTSVTFADIYTEVKRNKLSAEDLYDGNRYEITAKVNGMETGGLFNLTGGATLTMETQVGDTIVFFTAEFEKEQEDSLKQISVGDTITFIGTCYGANFTDCELQ